MNCQKLVPNLGASELRADGGARGQQGPLVGQLAVPVVAGQWSSNVGLTYEISQNGNTFGWALPEIGQVANGTVQDGAVFKKIEDIMAHNRNRYHGAIQTK